jgi:acetyl esterase/lipase
MDPDLVLEAPPVKIADLLALHDRVAPPPGFRYEPRVIYHVEDGEELTLHLYAPERVRPARPGVLFVHGGGWAGGCPTWHLRQACALAERGYVAATASYRLAPAVRWPDPLSDVKSAVRWLKATGNEIGLDPKRLVIAGGSAGGHLAALVALTPGSFESPTAADATSEVAGAVLWYPALDLTTLVEANEVGAAAIDGLLGVRTAELLRVASPSTYIHPSAPPILTLTGDLDQVTPLPHIRDFHGELRRVGVRNRLVVYAGRDHQFDLYPGDWEACFSETLEFVVSTVGSAP